VKRLLSKDFRHTSAYGNKVCEIPHLEIVESSDISIPGLAHAWWALGVSVGLSPEAFEAQTN
jgi:hypothetical protein